MKRLQLSTVLFSWCFILFLTFGCTKGTAPVVTNQIAAAQVSADRTDPRYAERQYRRFILPNQLKVLLISDPTIHRAAASLNVAAGSFNDPDDHPGLAHFLEHMLFLGTEKYPEAGSYQKFVAAYDGYSNAFTTGEQTNYHFQVAGDHLEEALDRFSQFFIAPLFNPEFVKREIEAVDSEHSKNLSSDYWRIRQISHLAFEEGHPLRKFSTGNAETLRGTTRETLLTFYKTHYSSNLMTLVVLGKEHLDTLQEWVSSRFNQIANQQLPIFTFPQTFLQKSEQARLLRIKTVKDTRSLQLLFPLPPVEQYYASKPLQALGSLLGDEGQGSLLSLLKRENLATGLAAGTDISSNSFSSFSLSVTLTAHGFENYQQVLHHIFAYINLIRQQGLPAYFYEDLKRMSDIDYQFEEKAEGTQVAVELASLMQTIPLDIVETAPFLLTQYDPKLFAEIVSHLTPENLLTILSGRDVQTDKQEPYYKADYAYTLSPQNTLLKWQEERLNPALRLPEKNMFIPQNLSLLPHQEPFQLTYQSLAGLKQEGLPEKTLASLTKIQGQTWQDFEKLKTQLVFTASLNDQELQGLMRKHAVGVPRKILDSPQGVVWFQRDFRVQTPKASLILRLNTPEVYQSPRHAVLSQLYAQSIKEGLNEFSYPVQLAGLGFAVTASKAGITLTISGYSDRILKLLTTLAGKLQTLTISQEIFAALKEQTLKEYQNMRFQQPYQQAFYHGRLLIEAQKYSIASYETAIADLTLEDVQTYAQQLYRHYFLEGLVHGNLEVPAVQQALTEALQAINGAPLPTEQVFIDRVIQLEANADYTFTRKVELQDSALVMGYQVGTTNPALRGTLQVISTILGSQFYTELRTRQQLGYILDAGMMEQKKTLSLLFLVQSGKYAPGLLQERVETFLSSFFSDLSALPPHELEQLKLSVINAQLKKSETIEEEAAQLFDIAFEKDAEFDHLSKDIQAVENLDLPAIQAVVKQSLLPEQRRRLALRMVGKPHEDTAVSGKLIESIEDFKTNHPCPQFCVP